jgi:triosephosphate isomerase
MRRQIAAANWKMNLSFDEAQSLVNALMSEPYSLAPNRAVLLAVPAPYLLSIKEMIDKVDHFHVCAQNCAATSNGAYTGEVSAQMLKGIGVQYVLIGHSERRDYFHEDNEILAKKINQALANGLQPVFCCGEPLSVRETGTQNDFVSAQLKDSLFHLSADQINGFIIAYEPIWAIGTGKTATSEQAQEMHAHIREVMAAQYGEAVAATISILYGGSVKANNAVELFSKPDVDGGLVGGASLIATEFSSIISSLK